VIVSVDLTTTPPGVRLDEPDDCKRFHVAARVAPNGGADPDGLARTLAEHRVGRRDGDDVWVQIEAVRGLAAGRVGAGWESDFAAMLAFARDKGWLDPSGTAIRAHVEWS
jgi:hypothetical protein